VDRFNFFRGIFASMDLLWPQLMAVDLPRQVPELRVPVYFLEGRHDHEAPSSLAAQYLTSLVAPRKRLVWFEHSGHFVNTEEAGAFNRFFVDVLLPEISSGPVARA
jgi:pimeloyl-ACP methyl ester carboxylesterase